jgi:hypothetical protein
MPTTILNTLTSRLTNLPNPLKTLSPLSLTATATIPPLLYLLLSSTPTLLTSYRTYLSLGPGGVPHNFLGFLVQSLLRVTVARGDGRAVPAPYCRRCSRGVDRGGGVVVDEAVGRRYAPLGGVSFLGGGSGLVDKGGVAAGVVGGGDEEGGGEASRDRDRGGGGALPPRRGERPTIPPFVAPQRQTDMQGSEDMMVRMQGFLNKLATANTALLEIRPSGLEGAWHAAVFLREAVPEYMGMAKGEIVHVHPEGSSHVTVSLVDAEEAVEKGW